jgi:DNA-binding CsgD family transcriptional regulator
VLPADRERFSDAARLLAAADAARPRLRYLTPGFTADRRAADRAASQARHNLGDDSFTQAWQEGQALALDDAIAYATRRGGGRKRPAAGWASLTPTELEVVRLVAAGLRNEAIAQRLFIAPGTVKVHLTHIFTKLGITTRTELAAQAATRDLRTSQHRPTRAVKTCAPGTNCRPLIAPDAGGYHASAARGWSPPISVSPSQRDRRCT